MARLLALACLTSVVLPVQAQSFLTNEFSDPTVWVSTSSGMIWVPASSYRQDVLAHDFSASMASSRWVLHGGVQVSDQLELNLDFSGMSFGRAAPVPDPEPEVAARGSVARESLEYGPYEVLTYRTVYAMGGPFATSRWFMAGAAAGPAITWGTREREVRAPCPPGNYCTSRSRERDGYINPGLAGSAQGFVRLDGRVWLGGETMAVVNLSSTHIATRLALRVDLLRPDR